MATSSATTCGANCIHKGHHPLGPVPMQTTPSEEMIPWPDVKVDLGNGRGKEKTSQEVANAYVEREWGGKGLAQRRGGVHPRVLLPLRCSEDGH